MKNSYYLLTLIRCSKAPYSEFFILIIIWKEFRLLFKLLLIFEFNKFKSEDFYSITACLVYDFHQFYYGLFLFDNFFSIFIILNELNINFLFILIIFYCLLNHIFVIYSNIQLLFMIKFLRIPIIDQLI